MPLVSQTFDQLLDFTRTTAGTFVGSDGLIQLTPASVNLFTQTQQFDNAAWTKNATTVTANSTVAPDGTSTADTLTATATTAVHNVQQTAGGSGSVLTLSIYAKAGTSNFVQMWHGITVQTYANFNLSTGVVGTVGTDATASITSVGNGWYRCSMTFTPSSAGTIRIALVTSATAAYNESWTAAGTESLFIWGAQVEVVPDANLVLGSELVTNPGPFSATTGWTAAVGSISTSSGSLVITVGAGGSARAVSSAMSGLTIGATYRINVSGVAGDASAKSIRITTNADGSTGALFTQAISGTSIIYYFVATATTHYLALPAGSVLNQTFSLSQASVKQITGTVGMPSTYTRNNGGVYPPRFDYDPVTLQPKGILIEEQRVNVVLRSEAFDNAYWEKTTQGTGIAPVVTANAATAPDGTMTADQVVFASVGTGTGDRSRLSTPLLGLASGTYTVSFWVKAASAGQPNLSLFVQSGVNSLVVVPTTEWVRYTYTATETNQRPELRLTGNVGILGTYYIWGAQLELGAFPTSYIPTVASTVTRTADQCSIVAPNFAPWYNQSEGTVVVEVSSIPAAGRSIYSVDNGTAGARILAQSQTAATDTLFRVVDTTDQVAIVQATGGAAGAIVKMASAYKINDFATSNDGAAVGTDTSGTVPTGLNTLRIGQNVSNIAQICGHVRSIRYYPVRLSNAQLQALTA